MSSESYNRASLVLNVVLTVTIAMLAVQKLGHTVASLPGISQKIATSEVAPGKAASKAAAFTRQPKLPKYGDIASASDRRRWIIDQLRAMGVPNDALALVARVDFEMQWENRFDACRGDRGKLAAVQLDMDMNKDAEMRAALGEVSFKQWDQKSMLWEAMSTEVEVTQSETDVIYALKKKLQQRQLELEQASVNGTMDDAEINNAQNKAYSEYNQQLKAVLGEDRYAKSQQLDDAFAAGNLRYTLAKAGLNPDDSQFQELCKAEQDLNKSQLKLDPSSDDYAAQAKALDYARDQQYRQTLGNEAFDTLQKEQDPGFCQMKKYGTLWGLDDNKIDYVYNAMKSYEQSVQDYQAQASGLQAQGQKVDRDAVNKSLQQLTDQTGQALQSYLGQYSFDKLQRNHLFLFNSTQSSQ